MLCKLIWRDSWDAIFKKAERPLLRLPRGGGGLLEGTAGQLQRGRHCYTVLLSENVIQALGLLLENILELFGALIL
jgi:hypothetical protein